MAATNSSGRVSDRWQHLSDYQCFGCAPSNSAGLRLEMTVADGRLSAPVTFADHHQSYPGVVHGGVVTTSLDEAMGNLLIIAFGVATFTMTLRTRFLEPLRTGVAYELRAWLTEQSERLYRVESELTDSAGTTKTLAAATYAPITPEAARTYLGLSEEEMGGLAHYLHQASARTEEQG